MSEIINLSRIELLIMLSIGNEPCHGYEIMQRAFAISEGKQKIGAGTLYVGIKRLVQSGLLKENLELKTNRRRYYELTSSGKQTVQESLAEYSSLLRWAHGQGWSS